MQKSHSDSNFLILKKSFSMYATDTDPLLLFLIYCFFKLNVSAYTFTWLTRLRCS